MHRILSVEMSSGAAATAAALLDDGRCPVCGSSVAEGGCADFLACTSASGRLENVYAHAVAGALTSHRFTEGNSLWPAILHAFDSLGIGLAICDFAAKVLASNTAAKSTLAKGDALQLTESGELRAVARNAPVLVEVMKRVQQTGSKDKISSQSKALLIPRKSGGRPVTLLLRRVDAGTSQSPSAQVVVMILDAMLSVEATSSDLQQLFGFTPGETRLANLLMNGKSMSEACDELGICLSTACSHLRKMFKKTKTHRQGELVALLLRSIGLLRSRIPATVTGEEGAKFSGRSDVSSASIIQVDVDSGL